MRLANISRTATSHGSTASFEPTATAGLLPRSGYDHIDLTAAALGADQPLSPIGHGHFGAVPLGHLGRVGLKLMPAILAPDD